MYSPKYGSKLEHAITRLLLKELAKVGYVPVVVYDGEEHVIEDHEPVKGFEYQPDHSLSQKAVLDAVFAVDDVVTIHFAPKADFTAWGNYGVMVIQGNGVDFISDYHSHDGEWNDAFENVYASLQGDALQIIGESEQDSDADATLVTLREALAKIKDAAQNGSDNAHFAHPSMSKAMFDLIVNNADAALKV